MKKLVIGVLTVALVLFLGGCGKTAGGSGGSSGGGGGSGGGGESGSGSNYTLVVPDNVNISPVKETYQPGDTVILEAMPIAPKHFSSWTDGNTDNPRTVIFSNSNISLGFNTYEIRLGTFMWGTYVNATLEERATNDVASPTTKIWSTTGSSASISNIEFRTDRYYWVVARFAGLASNTCVLVSNRTQVSPTMMFTTIQTALDNFIPSGQSLRSNELSTIRTQNIADLFVRVFGS